MLNAVLPMLPASAMPTNAHTLYIVLPNATNLCIGSALIKIIISNEIMAFDGSAVFSAMGWAGRTVAGGEARAPRSEQQPKRRATNGWTANTRPFIDERCMEKEKKTIW